MGAIVPTNGVLTFSASTQTFTPVDGGAAVFIPQNLMWSGASQGAHLIVQDAAGVTMLEIYNPNAGSGSVWLESHFFMGMRPWKCPIKCQTLTSGKVRMTV
jgi:hypothetical protein